MRRRQRVFVLLVLMIATTAFGQGTSGDLGRLKGKWWMRNKVPGQVITTTLVFDGDKVTMTTVDASSTSTSTSRIKINDSARPKQIDLLEYEVEGEAQVSPEKTQLKAKLGDLLGIYELGGDNLKLFFAPPKSKRPASMNAKSPGWDHISMYHRGEPPVEKATKKTLARQAMAVNSNQPGEFRGATIERIEGQQVLLRTADGSLARVGSGIGEAFGLDGRKLSRREDTRILKPGNVVDVETRRSTRTGQLFLASIRLIRGELLPGATMNAAPPSQPALSNEPAKYQRARIIKVSNYQMLVDVGGTQILLGSVTRDTKGFDTQGKPIAAGQATRLIWEGNVVDVVTDPPFRGADSASLREVRLVEGKVGEQNPATGLIPR